MEIKTDKKRTAIALLPIAKTICVLLILTFGLSACDQEQEGPAEKAGEEIDETIQQLQTDAKDTKQELEEGTEEILNDTQRAVEDAAD